MASRAGPTVRVAWLVRPATALLLVCGVALGTAPRLHAQAGPTAAKASPAPAKAGRKDGLLVNDPRAFPGYTLLAPLQSTDTYLIDVQGRVVRTWKSDCTPGASAYLLENGHLLRAGAVRNPPFFGGGAGGRIQEFDWDGRLVWDYTYRTDTELPHHDAMPMPNGNVLVLIWQKKAAKEVIAAGRRPETVGDGFLLSCSVYEIKPTGKTTGQVVWTWHAWDHLIQDFDQARANYGDVGAHPERIDLNFGDGVLAAMVAKPEELAKLRAIGYVGGAGRRGQRPQQDWLHINGLSYNAELDQVMLSVHEFSEFWIIDHSTTTAQAAGHQGGRYGKGGDLLYRWGNPRAYRAGAVKDQRLFSQHHTHWIARGLPGEGHVLVFNNGTRRTGGAHSSVDEIVLPVDSTGHYAYTPGKAFGPDKAAWTYVAPKRIDFFSGFISGAQRLPNGDTLICSGANGTVFEVTPAGETVWKYVYPGMGGPLSGGFPVGFGFGGPPGGAPRGGPRPGGNPFGGPPQLGQILPGFLPGFMNFTPEQKKQLEAAEKAIGGKLAKVLSDEQQKQLRSRPLGFGDLSQPGQLLSAAVQKRLRLTDEQRTQVAGLQKEADAKLDGILKAEQKKQLQQMKEFSKAFAAGGPPGGFPGGARAGFPGGPPGGGPGGLPAGPPGLFRAPRYAADFPGLAGKDLTPGKTVEELLAKKDVPAKPSPKAPGGTP